jgi:hypothetical protein
VVPAPFIDRDLLRRRRLAVVVGAIVVVLALVETVNAVVAPLRTPSDKDWAAAATLVRAEFKPGDLIVAAPAWADPVMRQKLGDLVPLPVAGRMDAARYGRIWEISQRGARAADTTGATVAATTQAGALTVRRWVKPAATVTFDFLAQWRQASMSVVNADGTEVPCAMGPGRWQCARGASLGPELIEVDTTLHNGLAVDPVEGATLALEFPAVQLGRELMVTAGLHNVWLRKAGDGKVRMRVLADGRELGMALATSQSGWSGKGFDTSALVGRAAKVRFEITVDKALARHFGFAAEARNP